MSYKYTFLDHTADIAVDIEADSLRELFIAAACAWRDSVTENEVDFPVQNRKLALSDSNLEILLVGFLSELNYVLLNENWFMNSIVDLDVNEKYEIWHLSAELSGFDNSKKLINLNIEIKAITYHQMEIKEKNGKYSTRIVFDI